MMSEQERPRSTVNLRPEVAERLLELAIRREQPMVLVVEKAIERERDRPLLPSSHDIEVGLCVTPYVDPSPVRREHLRGVNMEGTTATALGALAKLYGTSARAVAERIVMRECDAARIPRCSRAVAMKAFAGRRGRATHRRRDGRTGKRRRNVSFKPEVFERFKLLAAKASASPTALIERMVVDACNAADVRVVTREEAHSIQDSRKRKVTTIPAGAHFTF